MAYDETLASRVRRVLADRTDVTEKKMFGGLSFLVAGNMCCGIVGDELTARVRPQAYRAALARPHAREMDFTGRALTGYVYIGSAGLTSGSSLRAWVRRAVDFALTLAPKTR